VLERRHSPSVMSQDDEHEKHPWCRGRYKKEIDSNEVLDMLIEERPPGQPVQCVGFAPLPGTES
jgi:hypothetical protein